jgi:hypothetical protein
MQFNERLEALHEKNALLHAQSDYTIKEFEQQTIILHLNYDIVGKFFTLNSKSAF